MLVLEAYLQRVVADVTRTGSTDAELRVVADAVAVSLRAHVAPEAVRAGWALAIQEGVAVLDLEQAGVGAWLKNDRIARSKRDGRIVVKQREVLRVDRGELGVVRRGLERDERVLPAVVDVTSRNRVVGVAVLLVDVKLSDVTVLEKVVSVRGVFALEVALREVRHDGVENVLQATAALLTFFVHEALRELYVPAPVEARGLVVVLPVHEGATAVKFVVQTKRPCRSDGQTRRLVGVDVDFGHQVGALVGRVQTCWRACEVVGRKEIRIEERTVDVT